MKPLTLVVVADGLRPSAIEARTMPFVCQLTVEGTHYPQAFASFPALTRTNAATLATGCRPGRTGILGNQVWHPDLGPVDTGKVKGIRQLRTKGAMPRISLAERLARSGHQVLVVGNGSAGCTYVLNPGTDNGFGATIASIAPTASVFSAIPASAEAELAKLGPPPASGDRLEWAVAATVSAIATMSPDVLIFWSGQPDTVQHATGPYSSPTLSALIRVDDAVRAIHAAAIEGGRDCNTIVTADHGICETSDSLELTSQFDVMAASIGFAGDDVVLAYNGGAVFGYFRDHVGSRDRRRYAQQIAEQSWAGPVFCADEHCPDTAFAMSLALDGASSFTPDLIVTMRTNAFRSDQPDTTAARAIHARSAGEAAERGVHGTVHPGDLRIPLILHGPAFKQRTQQTFPAGIVDIAPTVHALVTGDDLPDTDGRILTESLVDRSHRHPIAAPPQIRTHRRGIHELALFESGDFRYLIGGSSTMSAHFDTTKASAQTAPIAARGDRTNITKET